MDQEEVCSHALCYLCCSCSLEDLQPSLGLPVNGLCVSRLPRNTTRTGAAKCVEQAGLADIRPADERDLHLVGVRKLVSLRAATELLQLWFAGATEPEASLCIGDGPIGR
jgi:hypothetical protein